MNLEIDDPKRVVLQIGAVLKKLRKEKRLSLEDLSELSGVSKLTLGNIERGETNPTIGMLWKISKSLSIPLMALFSTENNVNLSRAGEGLRIVGDGNNWAIEPVFQNKNNDMEIYRAYLQPNSTYYPEKHHHNTTELATIMSGTITINVNNESYILNQHDSISFSTDGTHSYANHTNDVVVLHIILKYEI
ncbi:helix-turn-helix domain-containing protein [Bacillus cereus]|uniref:helix-turn-helix domain-containing protein n=1 Tax=Bacillus cereus group TaxID=86661 RepID=UPI000D568B94|nr:MULTISPECIES: helix-turn-helix transcriptional regulator [Bacillus cereus group]MBD8077301.1 helix-turn-helix domain-containing protein [Bacillus thuringiensis]MCU4776509.1 helix-turn-helix domain-containing protein [Bacillus cereus]MCU4804894.1 helix-turn-helix domain-containing protein [Bacillus cereus]MCU5141933.1 helix-turn-helix domain-containing protein [Bacillus cereus]TKH59938.1 helix-turn-helix domain-containing protein [Bacillus cereus]